MAREQRQSMAARVQQKVAAGEGPVVMVRTRKSSHVAAVGYDKASRTLYVEYLEDKGVRRTRRGLQPARLPEGSTVVYRYHNVPPYIVTQALHAPSVGHYLWQRVYGRYRYVRLGRKGWRGPVGGHRARRKPGRETFKRV